MSETDNASETFDVTVSRGFANRLAGLGGSIVFTTYQCGKVFFVGTKPDGHVSIFERSFPRAMGVGISKDNQRFCLATKDSIFEFDNLLKPGQTAQGFDAYYAPHTSWITGDLDIHDLDYDPDGTPFFCATLFNCIGRVARGYSFEPIWKPDFISNLAAEDRCHLNGFDVVDGRAKYATCVGVSDTSNGWRDSRRSGGVVIDIDTQQVIAENLSMPHSPRTHDGRLWILNSGTGELGWIDVDDGAFNPIAFCPGFARGLKIIGDIAIVGLSEPREGKSFTGLPLQERLEQRSETARCGLAIFSLKTGELLDWLTITGVVTELFDVNFMEGLRNISLIGLRGDDVHKTISMKPVAP